LVFWGTNYYVYFTSFIAYPLQTDVIQTFRVWTWLFYFLLGSFIEEITSQLKNKIRFDVHLILTVVVTGIVLAFHYYVGTRVILLEGRILKAEYFYDSISDVIWVVLFFSLLLRINLCKRVEEFIRKFASLTLGIYIINFPLRLIVAHIIKVNSLTEAVFFG
jgi:surface polysaccharide O-acyltransferase-like enzyme